ncbi:MAG: type I CRISPR-associated protein Cas7 [Candidatus Scalinduaceae bacterium]
MSNNSTLSNRHETLFLWEVRKSNPNGDPSGNEPRIDRHTKRCDVTDVCIKRSVRDYISVREGLDSLLVTKLGTDLSETVRVTDRIIVYLFGTPKKTEESKKLVETTIADRLDKDKEPYKSFLEKTPSSATLKALISNKREDKEKLKKIVKENTPVDSIQRDLIKTLRSFLCGTFKDLRMFGSVLALEDDLKALGGDLTGPIQIEVGTSLHRVVHSNKQITSVMGSKEEHEAGIIGDTHCIEYGLFATSAIANENAARFTGLADIDHELFLKALWRGTRDRHTRSKNQVPRLLIDIEYNKPFHFGDLVNSVKLNPVERSGKLLDEEAYRSIDDFTMDLTKFYEKINSKNEAIKSIKFASNGLITLDELKNKLNNDLKDKVCEISGIDFDSTIEIEVNDFSEDAKMVIEGVKGITYCEPNKIITITTGLTEDMFKKIIEKQALQPYKDALQKAYNSLKEKLK